MVWDEIKMQREETIESFVSDYNGEIMELADGVSEIKDNLIKTVQIETPAQSAPIVCVMDSGIQEEHKYLAPAISSDESISLLPNNKGLVSKRNPIN